METCCLRNLLGPCSAPVNPHAFKSMENMRRINGSPKPIRQHCDLQYLFGLSATHFHLHLLEATTCLILGIALHSESLVNVFLSKWFFPNYLLQMSPRSNYLCTCHINRKSGVQLPQSSQSPGSTGLITAEGKLITSRGVCSQEHGLPLLYI